MQLTPIDISQNDEENPISQKDIDYYNKKLKFIKITLFGGGSYTMPIDKFDNELNNAEIGDKWILELIEMTQEEYDKLSDFAGH